MRMADVLRMFNADQMEQLAEKMRAMEPARDVVEDLERKCEALSAWKRRATKILLAAGLEVPD